MRIMKQHRASGASITSPERIVSQLIIQCVEVGLGDNSHSFVCKFALLTTGDALWNTLSAGILGFVYLCPKEEFNEMKQISNS